MFFAPITPEMAKYITDARREQERKSRKIPTFKEFYDKNYDILLVDRNVSPSCC